MQKTNPKKPAKIFEIKTGKGAVFSKIFELVQSYIKEVNILINDEGFFISQYDLSGNSLTKIDLAKDKFEVFHSSKPITIGVNTTDIYRTIKSISKKDTIAFHVLESDPHTLVIVLADPTGTTKEYRLPLLVINSQFVNIPNEKFAKYHHVINMPTSRFKLIIKDFGLFDTKNIEIKSSNKQLTFANCDGDAKSIITLNELSVDQKKKVCELLQGEDIKCINYRKCDDSIVQGKFCLRKLKTLIKATNLCEYMNIYIMNDAPIVLEYFCADMGPLKYMLTPN